MVLLSFPAACRDPEMFPDADKVIIDRKENRHAAFGLGIHRCVGSNLARMEMTVAVEELLKRIPEFSLDGEVKWSEGTVRGPRKLAHQVQLRATCSSAHAPPSPTGQPTGTTSTRNGWKTRFRSGTSCGSAARSRTRSASTACICRRATRTCAPSPTIRNISPRAGRRCARCIPSSGGGAPPITSDPPKHRVARMVLLPPFTPKAIEALTPKARVICNQLIDAFIDKGGFDGAVDYAQHIPVRVIAHMLGVPETDGDLFRDWINAILNEGITDYDS